jgi:hypothetical protein
VSLFEEILLARPNGDHRLAMAIAVTAAPAGSGSADHPRVFDASLHHALTAPVPIGIDRNMVTCRHEHAKAKKEPH